MDDTYTAVAEAAAAKKKARKAKHTAPALAPPLPEEEADGARGINQVHRLHGGAAFQWRRTVRAITI